MREILLDYLLNFHIYLKIKYWLFIISMLWSDTIVIISCILILIILLEIIFDFFSKIKFFIMYTKSIILKHFANIKIGLIILLEQFIIVLLFFVILCYCYYSLTSLFLIISIYIVIFHVIGWLFLDQIYCEKLKILRRYIRSIILKHFVLIIILNCVYFYFENSYI